MSFPHETILRSPRGECPDHRCVHSSSIFVAFALAWSIHADAQPPAIELRAVQPLATSIGSSVDLRTITANGLDQVDRLIFAHPGITATLKTTAPLPFDETPQPQFGHFTVTIASDVPRASMKCELAVGLASRTLAS